MADVILEFSLLFEDFFPICGPRLKGGSETDFKQNS